MTTEPRLRTRRFLPFFVLIVPVLAFSETVKTIGNPWTGKPDYITKVDSTTVGPLTEGATFYVKNSLTPGTTTQDFTVRYGIVLGSSTDQGTAGFQAGLTATTMTVSGQTVTIGTTTPNQGAFTGNGLTIGGNNSPFIEMIRNTSAGSSTLAVFRSGSTSSSGSSGIAFKSGSAGNQGQIVFQTSDGTPVKDRMTIDENGRFGFSNGIDATTRFVFVSSPTDNYSMKTGTSSAASSFHVAISTNGHFIFHGVAPTVSSCGVTPNGSVAGTDNSGTISVGGGAVTACTLTFASSWGIAPTCVLTDNSTAVTGDVSGISATAATFSFSISIGGGQIYYHCNCNGPSCL